MPGADADARRRARRTTACTGPPAGTSSQRLRDPGLRRAHGALQAERASEHPADRCRARDRRGDDDLLSDRQADLRPHPAVADGHGDRLAAQARRHGRTRGARPGPRRCTRVSASGSGSISRSARRRPPSARPPTAPAASATTPRPPGAVDPRTAPLQDARSADSQLALGYPSPVRFRAHVHSRVRGRPALALARRSRVAPATGLEPGRWSRRRPSASTSRRSRPADRARRRGRPERLAAARAARPAGPARARRQSSSTTTSTCTSTSSCTACTSPSRRSSASTSSTSS